MRPTKSLYPLPKQPTDRQMRQAQPPRTLTQNPQSWPACSALRQRRARGIAVKRQATACTVDALCSEDSIRAIDG